MLPTPPFNRIPVFVESPVECEQQGKDVFGNRGRRIPGDVTDRDIPFIGSPKINVLPGRIRKDGGVDVLGTGLKLSSSAAAGECRVAVRPERIDLGTGPFTGTVVHLENLGAEAFVHLAIAGSGLRLIARLADVRHLPAMGGSVTFGFAPDAVRIFDPAGKRIELRLEQAERVREPAHV